MKKIFLFLLLCLGAAQLSAQNKPYNVVFDITTADADVHARVVRWINAINEANPNAKVVVVFYGKSLNMVSKEKSTVADGMQKIIAGKKATFSVCEVAMKVHNINKVDLLSGVETVPDGIYELVKKQAEGYGYIKVVN
ncbi:DsrE family protein [Lacibacter sp.]|uniref:DsrE family protein n=1 Tax=Lacibacter sp. TaxID=1915409 RepID=UPI002B4AF14F|nr:DsrE family protein [Lacibacter sp.]HLP35535.1 DsrE family protein [Lacibacter sp.]